MWSLNMLKSPNESDLKEIFQNIDKEYDLQTRLNRYQSASPELLQFAVKENANDEEAPHALFVADFIVTASEIPSGSSDEDRYRSVIQSFVLGRLKRSTPDILMKIFYLAYKTASKIRRQDLFMGGRGLSRKAALIRLRDAFIAPYLNVVAKFLNTDGTGCGWELGVLSAALTRNYPDREIMKYEKAPSHSDQQTLIKFIWTMLENYSEEQKVDTNPNAVIPNISESKSILLFDSKNTALLSLWNLDKIFEISVMKKELQKLTDFLNTELINSNILLIKGYISKSNNYIFFVRDPFTPTKPLFILKTPTDEINVSRVLTVLRLRGLEKDGWTNVFPDKKTLKSPKDVPTRKEPIATESITTKIEYEKPKGLFAKIKNKIFGEKEKTESEKRKIQKPRLSPKKIKIDKFKEEIPNFIEKSSFIAQGITVDAVSNLDIYELWDTIREADYHIIGVFDSMIHKNKTIFSIKQDSNLHNNINSFLEKLDRIVLESYKKLFSANDDFILEEVFFMTPENNKLLLSLSGDREDRIVGTLATSIGDITEWQTRSKEKESLQRRSLHRRTKQFLAARRHTKFNEAIERIYSQNFDLQMSEIQKIDSTFLLRS
jgi:hypothetical protein